MPRLTRKIIDAAPFPTTGETWLADDSLPGFGIRIRPNRKIYCLRYRMPDGQSRRETLGPTTVLTLDEARTLGQALLVAVRQGRDPATERQSTRQAPTIAELATRYLAEHAEPHKKPQSVRHDRKNLRLHILPTLGKNLVTAVTRADVAKLHHELRATPTTANRCLALLSHMLSMAERWELRPQQSNPARGVQRYRERKVERFLSGEELIRLTAVLTQAEAQRTEHPSVIAAIRLLLFTGARLGEILALRWEYLDISNGVARLPDSKTGAKLLWLPAPALEILEALLHAEDMPWVLPGRLAGTHIGSLQRPWVRLCAQAGLEGVRVHDIRHTWASHAAMSGLSLPMIGQLLGHSSSVTTNRYIAWAHDPVRAASEQVGEALAAMLAPNATMQAMGKNRK